MFSWCFVLWVTFIFILLVYRAFQAVNRNAFSREIQLKAMEAVDRLKYFQWQNGEELAVTWVDGIYIYIWKHQDINSLDRVIISDGFKSVYAEKASKKALAWPSVHDYANRGTPNILTESFWTTLAKKWSKS